MALANIRQRLLAHYGETARLTMSADKEVFTTMVSYPLAQGERAVAIHKEQEEVEEQAEGV
jgi:LytS/YehU family sensor histidine kinase